MGYDWTDKRLCVFESVFLIDLSPTSAMIGWGRFPLRKAKSNPNLVTIVDRSEMRNPVEFVGEGALHTHDEAVVLSVRGPGRKLVGAPRTFWGGDKACARIDGLTPDTLYTYELTGVNSKRPFPSAGSSLGLTFYPALRSGWRAAERKTQVGSPPRSPSRPAPNSAPSRFRLFLRFARRSGADPMSPQC